MLNKIKIKPTQTIIMGIIMLVILLFLMRYRALLALELKTNQAATTIVNTIKATPTPNTSHVVLPGSVMAWHEASIYARAKGFLKVWYVDIGYHVHRGQLLALIERPELDAQLKEAEDYLKVVLAQNTLAQITANRWKRLVVTDSVSKQANDDKNYQAQALVASVSQARAAVEKLKAYVGFEEVLAPFTGIISLRNTDIGDLINIGSQPAQTKPLFKIVQIDPLRLYVNIPQTYSSLITPKMHVNLTFSEHPGKIFSARLLKTANAIDTTSLTLQAEFRVENKDGVLLPGSYTVVDFSLPSYPNSVILPINTLIFRAEGLQVAVVDNTQHIALKNVTVGTDFGKSVQINSGIMPGEQIVLNPIDSLNNGQLVKTINIKPESTS